MNPFLRKTLVPGFGAVLTLVAGAMFLTTWPAAAQDTVPSPAIAMHGEPAMPSDFRHLPFANPDAPKGGMLHRAEIGSFDSLNPFIVTGRPGPGLNEYLFPTLMARSWDEPFTLYSYVAETVETPQDRSWVAFQLNPNARFHDGTPITVDDVIYSMETLREHGTPSRRRAHGKIAAVERIGEHGIRFDFAAGTDRETALLMAMMPIISKAYWSARDITQTTLEPPLGGGPYRIASVEPGRSIVYQRVEDWWGADLPFFKGQMNFDTLRYDYYRDAAIALEAFKAGDYNYRVELSPEQWLSSYDFPAARSGEVTMMPAPHGRANGMRGFAFNTRRDMFADPTVREALTYAFDFEALNRTYLAGQYQRLDSFFDNSDLGAEGLPQGPELGLLERFRDQLPEALFTEAPQLPVTDGSGNNRQNLRTARELLASAGWTVQNNVLTNQQTGAPMRFEILLGSPSDEKVALAFIESLKRLGISASVRTVDSAQYAARLDTYDFDMIIHRWAVSLSPGTEQYTYWGSASADANGTRNYAGVKSPVVDALTEAVASAMTREDLKTATRALDRVLLWGHYVIPLYFTDKDYIAYWRGLRHADAQPLYGLISTVDAWWAEP